MANLAHENRQVNTAKLTEKPEHFVRLNKNFANYPLARDSRAKADWFRTGDEGNWVADLPGDKHKRLRLLLPDDIHDSFKRLPTAFDLNTLFLLSAEASRQKRPDLSLSRGWFLKTLRLSTNGSNRRRLSMALDYWATITVKFDGCWYEKKKRYTLYIDPPVKKIGGPSIRISDQWFDILNRSYFEAVPLPLPMDAAAQNLVLVALVSAQREKVGPYDLSFQRKLPGFYGKLGLDHNNRRPRLNRITDVVGDWFCDHCGEFAFQVGNQADRISFMLRKPKFSGEVTGGPTGPEDFDNVAEDEESELEKDQREYVERLRKNGRKTFGGRKTAEERFKPDEDEEYYCGD